MDNNIAVDVIKKALAGNFLESSEPILHSDVMFAKIDALLKSFLPASEYDETSSFIAGVYVDQIYQHLNALAGETKDGVNPGGPSAILAEAFAMADQTLLRAVAALAVKNGG